MTRYRVATGHDIALDSLTIIDPQPRNGEVKTTRRYADDGPNESALYAAFVWDVLETAAQYQAILEDFGLLDALYADVTIYTRDEVFNWTRYNGTAIRPEIGQDGEWQNYFARNFVIYVRDLEALVEA